MGIDHRFAPTARAMAQSANVPEFPFAVIPHPISNNSEDVLRAKAEDAVQQCVKILLERSL